MNCALFAKMDQIFSSKKWNIKKILEKWQKKTGKVKEFCQSGKVGTLSVTMYQNVRRLVAPSNSWTHFSDSAEAF